MLKNAVKYIQILTTTPDRTTAEELARKLVDKKIAACIQIVGPIKSVYRWEGKIEVSTEYLCQIKTSAENYQSAEKLILENHPYEVPEIISFNIENGFGEYLNWISDSTSI